MNDSARIAAVLNALGSRIALIEFGFDSLKTESSSAEIKQRETLDMQIPKRHPLR